MFDQFLPGFLGHILILFGVFLAVLIVSFCGLWLLNSSVAVIKMLWIAAITTPRKHTRKLYSEAILNRNWNPSFTVEYCHLDMYLSWSSGELYGQVRERLVKEYGHDLLGT
ncbi:hypothetical protein E4U30_003268 [Claviceps sp. LM220 group G6]|nr:hypothetical protein E4U30_003268 [Claviceps sp. LM220 group G6]